MIEIQVVQYIPNLAELNTDLYKDGEENTWEETPRCEGSGKATKSATGQNQDEGIRSIIIYFMIVVLVLSAINTI